MVLGIGSNNILFKIDTGASVNVIDSKTFEKLKLKPVLNSFDRLTYPKEKIASHLMYWVVLRKS